MKRGDLVTVALQGDLGKPRPALIIQSDFFDLHPTVTVLPLTSEMRDLPLFRVLLTPDDTNGLAVPSQVMVDKTSTVAKHKIGGPFGQVSPETMLAVERCLAVFLGIAK